MVTQEMTLEEWCNKLPKCHLVNKQLEELKKTLTTNKDAVAESPAGMAGLSLLPVDKRRLGSVISDIKLEWNDGTKEEYHAMEYGIRIFHDWLCEQIEKKR